MTSRAAVMIEFAALAQDSHCPIGIYVTPTPSDIFKWSGVLFVHRGYYAGAILHFSLTIPKDYPCITTPTIHFDTDIYHPLVDPSSVRESFFIPSNLSYRFVALSLLDRLAAKARAHAIEHVKQGKLNTMSRFPRWKQREDYLFHVLHFIKTSFKRKALDELREANCFNKEAFALYRDQNELFTKLAAQSALLSVTDSSLYSDSPAGMRNPPGIHFSKLDETTELELMERIGSLGPI